MKNILRSAWTSTKRIFRTVVLTDFGIFLSYLSATACIVIVDWRVPLITSDQIPDWLQAIAAIGTLGVAYAAYRNWKYPDFEKRQTAFAEELLTTLFVASSAMRSSRRVHVHNRLLPVHYAISPFALALSEQPKAMQEPVEALRARMVLAKRYFGTPVADAIIHLSEDSRKIARAYQNIAYLHSLAPNGKYNPQGNLWPADQADWDEQAKSILADLGVHFGQSGNVNMLMGSDDFDREILAKVKLIEEAIDPYIDPRLRKSAN